MSHLHKTLIMFLCTVAAVLFSGCSADSVQKRQDNLTGSYMNTQQKRQIRAEARQERSNAWFNRIMGEPVKGTDTGLKLPPE